MSVFAERSDGSAAEVGVDPAGAVGALREALGSALDVRGLERYDIVYRSAAGEEVNITDIAPATPLAEIGILGAGETMRISLKYECVAREMLRAHHGVDDAPGAMDAVATALHDATVAAATDSPDQLRREKEDALRALIRLVDGARLADDEVWARVTRGSVNDAIATADTPRARVLFAVGLGQRAVADGLRGGRGEAPFLADAIDAGADGIVDLLLRHGVAVEAHLPMECRALNAAAARGRCAVCEVLLDHGADVDGRDPHGATALIAAVRARAVDAVDTLLRRGADPAACDSVGNTPLIWAARHADVDSAACLLAARAAVDAADGTGRTPLAWAATYGNVDVVRVLLAHGADAHAADDEGETPVSVAERYTQRGALALLRAAAAGGDC